MKSILAAMVAASLALAGCATYDPYTGERETSKATKGAIFGALGGAAIGALTNTSSGKEAAINALIGAGIGGLAGGAVGAYMDQQEAKLRQRLAGTGVGIERDPVTNQIKLIMPGNVTFATNSANINQSFYQVLSDVGLVLNEFDKTYINVDGHTDSTGSNAYNLDLSQRRANSVGQFLVTQKVMAQRLIVNGFGEERPVADNSTPDGRQMNRRVEIQISPLTEDTVS